MREIISNWTQRDPQLDKDFYSVQTTAMITTVAIFKVLTQVLRFAYIEEGQPSSEMQDAWNLVASAVHEQNENEKLGGATVEQNIYVAVAEFWAENLSENCYPVSEAVKSPEDMLEVLYRYLQEDATLFWPREYRITIRATNVKDLALLLDEIKHNVKSSVKSAIINNTIGNEYSYVSEEIADD